MARSTGTQQPPEAAYTDTNGESDVGGTGRVEAFSDGVFAIAVTLLVLDLHLDTTAGNSQSVLAQLLGRGPQYMGFLVSFATIGITWINHHRLFTHISRTNTTLLLLNLLLLLGITVLPFPTSVMAEHLGDGGTDGPTAITFYNAVFIYISIAYNVLWRYAAHNGRLLHREANLEAVKSITRQYLFGPLFYLVSLAVGLFFPQVSLGIDLLLAVFFALPGPPITKREGP